MNNVEYEVGGLTIISTRKFTFNDKRHNRQSCDEKQFSYSIVLIQSSKQLMLNI